MELLCCLTYKHNLSYKVNKIFEDDTIFCICITFTKVQYCSIICMQKWMVLWPQLLVEDEWRDMSKLKKNKIQICFVVVVGTRRHKIHVKTGKKFHRRCTYTLGREREGNCWDNYNVVNEKLQVAHVALQWRIAGVNWISP